MFDPEKQTVIPLTQIQIMFGKTISVISEAQQTPSPNVGHVYTYVH